MRTGRLAISRGFSAPEPQGEPARFAIIDPVEAPTPFETAPALEPTLGGALATVNARISALERLTRLCEAGALTVDEFLVEKAAILGHHPSDLSAPRASDAPPISFRAAESRRPKSRSLAGRLGWMLIPLGLVAGLGLSALSQPELTERGLDEAMRIIGV